MWIVDAIKSISNAKGILALKARFSSFSFSLGLDLVSFRSQWCSELVVALQRVK